MAALFRCSKDRKIRDSVYSVVSSSEVTPGSLDVWIDLPEDIRRDPSLAAFRRIYEQRHGKLENSIKDNNKPAYAINAKENSKADRLNSLDDDDSSRDDNDDDNAIPNSGNRMIESKDINEEKIKRVKKKRLMKILRILKLTSLVASWLLLTVALVMNEENVETSLHTAVSSGYIKEYNISEGESNRVLVNVILTGPFAAESTFSNGTQGNHLQIWLHGTGYHEDQLVEKNSSIWVVSLQPEENLDFAPSATVSRTLAIDLIKTIVNGTIIWKDPFNDTKITLRLSTVSNKVIPLTLSIHRDQIAEADGIVYAALLLSFLYVLIIFEIVNRTIAALLSSTLAVAVLALCGSRPSLPELLSWLDVETLLLLFIVNRTIAALLSSTLAVAVLALCGSRPSLPELLSWLDVETLLLLFSMMILVSMLAETGLFDYAAVRAFELTGGQPWPLITSLCLFTAVSSTVLDNVTTVLLVTPVTIRLCEVMNLNPINVLMSMVIFSNVGGAATPVGDPPNVIIASHPSMLDANINFLTFTLHMGVGILFVGAQTYLQLRLMFRRPDSLRHTQPAHILEMQQEIAAWRRAAASLTSYSKDEDIVKRALDKQVRRLKSALRKREAGGGAAARDDPKFCSTLAQMKEKHCIRDRELLVKCVVAVSFVVVVFFLHAVPELQRLSLGWTALLGALLLLILAEREDLEPVLARVEWSTLLFFAALFVFMEALTKLGLIAWLGGLVEALIMQVDEGARLAAAVMLVLWVSGLASAFVDNIPLATMMVRVTSALAGGGLALPLAPLAWALSFGACLGGNGTLIGASANVVCAGVAEQHGYKFTFVQYFKIGFPIMVGNLLVASVYLLICHCAFEWH